MKNILKSTLAILLLSGLLHAEDNNTVQQLEGTSIGHYQKPGAAVDINYSTDIVQASEASTVHITLSSPVTEGRLEISLSTEGRGLILPKAHSYGFDMNSQTRSHSMELSVYADEEDRYYITLVAKIVKKEHIESRVFSIPVQVGLNQKIKKPNKNLIQENGTGRKIVIMPVK